MAGTSRGSAARRVKGVQRISCAHCRRRRAAVAPPDSGCARRSALQCLRMSSAAYIARRAAARSRFLPLRGLRYHLLHWGDAALATPERPPLVLLHGWMDVGASFQFVVDALARADGAERWVVAPDWRGFGLTDTPRRRQLLVPRLPGRPRRAARRRWRPAAAGRPAGPQHGRQRGDELRRRAARSASAGWSTSKASACRETRPEQAPKRLAQWLDELKTPPRCATTTACAEVAAAAAARTTRCSPPTRRAWLAPHWSRAARRRPLAHPGRPGAQARQPGALPQATRCWDLEADHRAAAVGRGRPHRHRQVVGPPLPAQRIRRAAGRGAAGRSASALSPCGHMLHHDQPEALARSCSASCALSRLQPRRLPPRVVARPGACRSGAA